MRIAQPHSSMLAFWLLGCVLIWEVTASDVLTFNLYGLQDIKIRRVRDNTLGDSYRNYQFLTYSESVKPFIANRGLGVFVNVSYANLYLQFSLDQSTLLLVSDKCVNCEHRLYNTTHSVTSYIYGFESDECWSNLFALNTNSTSECFVSFRYHDAEIYGKIGYENIYFGIGTSIITITDIIFVTFHQGELLQNNIQGIFGLGNSDIEGNFGHSLLENLLDAEAITSPHILVCANNLGRGFLTLGANLEDHGDVLWTKQKSPFYYAFHVSELTLADLTIRKSMVGSINFNTAYLKFTEAIFDSIHKTVVNLVCNSQGNQTQVSKLCEIVDKMMLYNSRAILQVSDLEFLQRIETPVFTLVGDKRKALQMKVSRIFGICEDVTQNYNSELTPNFNETTEVEVCVWIVKNTENDNDIIFGNLINSENGTIYFFDKERGRMGFIRDYSCKEEGIYTVSSKHFFSVFMAEKITIIVILAILVIASLNKCDEYFYEDIDPSNEESMTGLSLTNARNTNTQNNRSETNEPNEAREVSPQRLDDSGLQNVSAGQIG